jgi:FKBP-type peptidyl-prolyl cis-trans isomerase
MPLLVVTISWMKRAIVIGVACVLVGLGATIGITSWWQAQQATEPVSKGGSVALEDSGGESQALGAVEMSGTSQTAGQATAMPQATPTPTSQASSASESFAQYDQYKEKTDALYQDLQVGTGAAVTATSTVVVDYRGWLTNGQVFDESYAKGKPYSFTMGTNSVIRGWEQGVFGMKVGGKRRVIVPPSVGYGNQANGSIPAGSLLIFDIQLHEAK